jgi:2'-5' RNA ligase
VTKRRLFIAINLPDGVKKKLLDWQIKMADLIVRRSLDVGGDPKLVRWTNKFNLHITLLFVGYVTDEEMYEICSQVKAIGKKHEPFFLRLEKIILGPPDKNPRMFWAQGEKSQELADLLSDLNNAIQQRTGFKYKAFRPHITLARFRAGLLKFLPESVDEPFKCEIPVDSIEVMESVLKRTGAEYAVLESVELEG